MIQDQQGLLRSIHNALKAIEKQSNTIAEYTRAQRESQHPKPPGDPQRISITPIQFEPAAVQRYYSDQKKTYTLQVRGFWVGFITLLVLGAYTVFTLLLVINANSTLKQSRTALSATIQNSNRDQRAWVGVEAITGNIELGRTTVVTVHYRNSGKTPALKLVTISSVEPVDKGKEPSFIYDPIDDILSSSVLQPNAIYRNILNAGGKQKLSVTKLGYDRVKSGDLVLFVFGKITYEDIFHQPHWTTFCMYFNSASDTWNAYKTYNDVDPEPIANK